MTITHHGAGQRLGGGVLLLAVLVFLLTIVSPASAQMLRVYAGALAEPPERLPLALPEMALEPAFDDDVESYRLRVPHTTTGISLVSTAYGDSPGAEAESADGSDLSIQGWLFSRAAQGGLIMSFDGLAAGDNIVRVALGFPLTTVYTFVVNRAAEVSSVAVLTALELSSGEFSPSFARDAGAYNADVPGGVTSVTITATPSLGGRVIICGRSSEGAPLEVDGDRVSGLTVGDNRITVGVTAEDGADRAEYSLVVHRDAPTGSVVLDDLQLSEGPPAAGFMMSAIDGALPEGTARPTPAFSSEVSSYALAVSDPLLTIRVRAPTGSSFAAAGTAVDGSTLQVVDQSQVDSGAAFLSVTLGELAVGENTITLTVIADDETVAPATATLLVTRTAGE